MRKPLVSLCMPTNGVIEWVFPVLDSIYNQNIDVDLYEIVIADNGNNSDFKNRMKEYIKIHKNIVYVETKALPFINEIESYKNATGELIKFVNHRTKLEKGTLEKFINLVNKYKEDKPVIYFSNAVLNIEKDLHEYDTFDEFVRNLSYWSSWSTGMTIWKSDFEKLPVDVKNYNELFPHTNILFKERKKSKYIIDNTKIFDELPVNGISKAKYDLFYAFAVEYPGIILNLLMDKAISIETFLQIKKELLEFIAILYSDFVIHKKPCSYDLSSLNKSIKIFYSKRELQTTFNKRRILNIIKRRK